MGVIDICFRQLLVFGGDGGAFGVEIGGVGVNYRHGLGGGGIIRYICLNDFNKLTSVPLKWDELNN